MSYLADDADRLRAMVPSELVPSEDAQSLFLLYAVLLHVRGDAVTRRDVHEAWTAWMELRDEQHDSMRPFDELSAEVQAEDEPFVAAIRAAATRLT